MNEQKVLCMVRDGWSVAFQPSLVRPGTYKATGRKGVWVLHVDRLTNQDCVDFDPQAMWERDR